jgi:hypothetical protein
MEDFSYLRREDNFIFSEDHYLNGLLLQLQLLTSTKPQSGFIRLLEKPADADEVQGVSGAQIRSVQEVLEDASIGATPQFAAAVGFCKKSIPYAIFAAWEQ